MLVRRKDLHSRSTMVRVLAMKDKRLVAMRAWIKQRSCQLVFVVEIDRAFDVTSMEFVLKSTVNDGRFAYRS